MATILMDKAKKNKADEFYTQLSDIELEMKHYKEQFKGKTIFCNCDDPFESNFFKYFAMNFNHLGLKKLICTCYATSPVAWVQLSLFDNANIIIKTENKKQPYKIEITEVLDYNGDGAVDLSDVEYLLKNKKIAHFEREFLVTHKKSLSISIDNLKKSLELAERIVNKVGCYYDRTFRSFSPINISDIQQTISIVDDFVKNKRQHI